MASNVRGDPEQSLVPFAYHKPLQIKDPKICNTLLDTFNILICFTHSTNVYFDSH